MDAATLKSYLHKRGYRITAQRMAVLDEITRNENKHLSASEIHSVVKLQYPRLGIATVYKNLRMLEQEGVVNKFDLLDNTGHYEMGLDYDAHCHLLCLACGCINESEEDFVQHICELLQKKSGFIMQKRALVFYGYCKKCLAQDQKDRRKDDD